jgi:hypothetical protein
MPKANDTNKITAKQVSKVTKTSVPKGEDLLGSEELKKALAEAKKRLRTQ